MTPNSLYPGQWTTHRALARGAGVLADGAASTLVPGAEALLNCLGYETILVRAELTGGVVPTVDLEPLFVDGTAFVTRPTTGALGNRVAVEVDVRDQKVLLRLNAVVGAPTGVVLRVAGGRPSRVRAD